MADENINQQDLGDIDPIPPIVQDDTYSCGAAVATSVAHFFGLWTHQEEVKKALGTNPETGTTPESMVTMFTTMGLKARLIEDIDLPTLIQHIKDRDKAVIVMLQAWADGASATNVVDYTDRWEDGHYVIAVGANKSNIYFRDPSLSGSLGFLSEAEFLTRWHDYETVDGKERR